MLSYLRPTRIVRRHYVGDGLVGCPVQGRDVDVEVCLHCRSLRGVAQEGRPYVVCEGVTPEPPLSVAELVPPHMS